MTRSTLSALLLFLPLAGACDPDAESFDAHRMSVDDVKGGISCDCPDCSFWMQAADSILLKLDADVVDLLREQTPHGMLRITLESGRVLRVPVDFKALTFLPPNSVGADAKYHFDGPLSQGYVRLSDAAESEESVASLDAEEYDALLEELTTVLHATFGGRFGNTMVSLTTERCDDI